VTPGGLAGASAAYTSPRIARMVHGTPKNVGPGTFVLPQGLHALSLNQIATVKIWKPALCISHHTNPHNVNKACTDMQAMNRSFNGFIRVQALKQ
jgi:hypothetical protein